jgi:hypothetical protein
VEDQQPLAAAVALPQQVVAVQTLKPLLGAVLLAASVVVAVAAQPLLQEVHMHHARLEAVRV